MMIRYDENKYITETMEEHYNDVDAYLPQNLTMFVREHATKISLALLLVVALQTSLICFVVGSFDKNNEQSGRDFSERGKKLFGRLEVVRKSREENSDTPLIDGDDDIPNAKQNVDESSGATIYEGKEQFHQMALTLSAVKTS